MKISASQSLLLATLAVSSSSSALVAPSGDGHPESVVNASSSSAIASSTSSDSLGPKESGIPERDAFQDSIAERSVPGKSVLDNVGCTISQTLTSLLPLPLINDLLCTKAGREGNEGSIDQDKVKAELHQLSSALNRAAFATSVSGSPLPSSSSNSSSTFSDANPTGMPSNSSRVDLANSPANATEASASSSISSSMSATSIWRAQPTPANSPSLPVDSPPPQSSASNSSTATVSGDGAATSSATA